MLHLIKLVQAKVIFWFWDTQAMYYSDTKQAFGVFPFRELSHIVLDGLKLRQW